MRSSKQQSMDLNKRIFKYSISGILISNIFHSSLYFPLAIRYFENKMNNTNLLSFLILSFALNWYSIHQNIWAYKISHMHACERFSFAINCYNEVWSTYNFSYEFYYKLYKTNSHSPASFETITHSFLAKLDVVCRLCDSFY